jgi:hypothetical protein
MKCYDINCPKGKEQDLIRSITVIPQFFVPEAFITARHFDLALHQLFFLSLRRYPSFLIYQSHIERKESGQKRKKKKGNDRWIFSRKLTEVKSIPTYMKTQTTMNQIMGQNE